MKKSYLAIIVAIIVIAVAAVGAFMLMQVPLEAHDFGSFSMDIPEKPRLEEVNASNGIQVMLDAMANSSDIYSFLDNYAAALQDPANYHPAWVDYNHNITIQYINCSEDGIADHQAAMDLLFAEPQLQSSQDNIFVYSVNMNDTDDNDTSDFTVSDVVCVENGGNSMVIIAGSNSDLLKKMAETVKFK